MNGQRVYFSTEPDAEYQLKDGEYASHPHSRGLWLVRPPQFMTVGLWDKRITGRADHHEIEEHADGTISVAGEFSLEWLEVKRTPSGDGRRPVIKQQKTWKGTLQNGVWKESGK